MSFTKFSIRSLSHGFFLAAVSIFLSSCSSADDGAAPAPYCTNATQGASSSVITTSLTNIIPVYVADPATTGSIGYANEPLVSITICSPNHTSASQCQTISNILLDTGSFGLRLFTQTIASNVALAQQTVTVQGQIEDVAECVEFGTGADWGGVENGDLILGNQTAINIPIQVIDYNFSQIPSACASLSPDTNPCSDQANFNGILGVGVFPQDCGNDCNSTDPSTNPGQYLACDSVNGCFNVYSGACAGGSCAVAIPTSSQVENPIAVLGSGFNNGISLSLPSISTAGASQVSGSFTIGIGVTASNVPGASVKVYYADPNGETDSQGSDFLSEFDSGGGTVYGIAGNGNQAYLDSGSTALLFPSIIALPDCTDGSGLFCPASLQSLTATIESYNSSGSGSPSTPINFSVQNGDALVNSSNSAFNDVAGDIGGSGGFDWGLTFFFGRTVYVGIGGTTASFNGTPTNGGPYWGF